MTATYSPKYTTSATVRSLSGIPTASVSDDNLIDIYIQAAEYEIDEITQNAWTSQTAVTEIIPSPKEDIDSNKGYYFFLNHYPILSITSITVLDEEFDTYDSYGSVTSASITAYTYVDSGDEYTVNPITGEIRLISDEIPQGYHIKAIYTYGYSSVPFKVQRTAAIMSAMRAWVGFLGGNYNYLNSYTIPEMAVNKGDLYVRGKGLLEAWGQELDELIGMLGDRRKLRFKSSGAP